MKTTKIIITIIAAALLLFAAISTNNQTDSNPNAAAQSVITEDFDDDWDTENHEPQNHDAQYESKIKSTKK